MFSITNHGNCNFLKNFRDPSAWVTFSFLGLTFNILCLLYFLVSCSMEEGRKIVIINIVVGAVYICVLAYWVWVKFIHSTNMDHKLKSNEEFISAHFSKDTFDTLSNNTQKNLEKKERIANLVFILTTIALVLYQVVSW